MPDSLDLTTLDGLQHASQNYREGGYDGTFCSGCGAIRRMNLEPLHRTKVQLSDWDGAPHLFTASCVQCHGRMTLAVHVMNDGAVRVVALPRFTAA